MCVLDKNIMYDGELRHSYANLEQQLMAKSTLFLSYFCTEHIQQYNTTKVNMHAYSSSIDVVHEIQRLINFMICHIVLSIGQNKTLCT